MNGVVPHPACSRRCGCGGSWAGSSSRRPLDGLAGATGVRGRRRAGRVAATARRRRRAHATAHDHVPGAAPDRAHARRGDRRGGPEHELARSGPTARGAAGPRAGPLAGTRRDLRPTGRTVGVRVERLPRPHPAPRGRRGRPTTRSTGGVPERARRGSSSAPGPCTPSSSGARRLEAHASAPCSSPPGSRRTSACSTTFGAPDVLVCTDELNHASIIDGCRLAAGRRRGLPPPRPRPRGRAARRPAACRAHRRHRHGVLDGRRPRRRRAPRGAVRRRARCSCSTRRTRCSAPILDAPGMRRVASARCRRRSARSAASSPGPRAILELIVNQARSRPLHDPALLPPTPQPRRRATASFAPPTATRSSPASAGASTGSGPDHPSPIVPFIFGDEARTLLAAAAPCSTRACSSPPQAADGAARTPRAFGSRSRPRVRHLRRSTRCRRPLSQTCDGATGTASPCVAGTGTAVGERGRRPRCWARLAISQNCASAPAAHAMVRRRRRAHRRRRIRPRDRRAAHDIAAPSLVQRALAPPMAADALGHLPPSVISRSANCVGPPAWTCVCVEG